MLQNTDETPINYTACCTLADLTHQPTIEAEKIKNAKRGEYCIIYADPAWKYNNKPNKKGRAVECHYKTMDIEEIKALPIKDIAYHLKEHKAELKQCADSNAWVETLLGSLACV